MSHLSPLILTVTQRKKNSNKNPQSWFWKLRYYFPKEAGQSSDLPGCRHGEEDARRGCRTWRGGAAEGCLPPLPCPRASPSQTRPRLHRSTQKSPTSCRQPLVSPKPQGRVAEAVGNIPRKGISFADNAFDVAKLQAPRPGGDG